MRLNRTQIVMILLLALPCMRAQAGSYTLLEPTGFQRSSGAPVTESLSFAALDTASVYTINVYNGGLEDHPLIGELVSSSVISLNGQQIFGPDEFNQDTIFVTRPINVQSENELTVELRGKPGGVITLEIIGEDSTPPLISTVISPVANATGWHVGDVTVSFQCSDGASSIAVCPAPVVVTTEGAGQIVGGTASDRAGNQATASVTLYIDKTLPAITPQVVPAPNTAGWNRSDVNVSFDCHDALSGIDTCTAPVTLTNEVAGQTVNGAAADIAGNNSSNTVAVSIDKTPPVIDVSLSAPANTDGWHRQPVTLNFTCSDVLSGMQTCPVDIVVTTEGRDQVVIATAVDLAGNTADISRTVSLDVTAPAIAITNPQAGTQISQLRPAIELAVSDNLALDATSLSLTVNGLAFPGGCSVDLSNQTAVCTPAGDLPRGDVTLQAAVGDMAGNIASAQHGFHIQDDRDGDGVLDAEDAFPDDPFEWADLDNDGIGDNGDPDRDGDGVGNDYEVQAGTDPNDPESVPPDFDGDGIPDSLDDDRDGDGAPNAQDTYPDDTERSQLAAVNSVQAGFAGQAIGIAWTAIADGANVVSYNIYRNEAGGAPALLVTVPDSQTAYSDTGIVNGTGYEYQVRGMDPNDNEGAAGNTAQVFVAYNDSQVSGLQAGREGERVRLNWNTVAGMRYQVWRAAGGATPEMLSEVAGNSYLDGSAVWNQAYVYQVATLADFLNPFTNADVTLTGPLSPVVTAAPIPPLNLILEATPVSTGNWELLVDAADTVSLVGRVDEALGPLAIRAQSGEYVLTAQSADGEFRLALPRAQGVSWTVTATETTVATRNVSATVVFVSDTQAPVITPDATPATVNTDTLRVVGTVNDDRGAITAIFAKVDRSGEQSFAVSLGANGAFTTEVPLQFGENLITLTAVDASGNIGQAQLSVRRAVPIQPALFIISPADGTQITQTPVTVSGLVYSSLAPELIRLTLGTQTLFPTATGSPGVYSFTFGNMPLSEGANTLSIQVTTPSATTVQQSTVFYRPAEADEPAVPPEITLSAALSGSTVNDDLVVVRGTARSAAGISGVTVDFETATLSGISNTEVQFTRTVDISAMPGSELTLPVTATDTTGLSNTILLTLFRDTDAPVITITTPGIVLPPDVNTVAEAPLILTGQIADAHLSAFTVNGQNVGLLPGVQNGTWLFEVAVETPYGQDHTVTLAATDRAGQQTQRDLTIRLDTPITIEFIQPAAGLEMLTTAAVTEIPVTARVNGRTATDSVSVYLGGGTPEQMSLDGNMATHALATMEREGQHRITVDVRDEAGALRAQSHRDITLINADAIPLEVERTQPANNAKNISISEFIALYFNKPIVPADLQVEVKESVHGKTWDLTKYEDVDPLQAGAVDPLVEVHRDQAPVPGSLSIFPGEKVVSYHLLRELAYGADVFVTVRYAGEVIEDFTFRVETLPTLVLGAVVNQLSQPVAGLQVSLPALDLNAKTDGQGLFSFGFGDNPEFRIPAGRHKIVFNPGQADPRYGSVESYVNLQYGIANRVGITIVPALSKQIAYQHIRSGGDEIVLAGGELRLHAAQADFLFPDHRNDGNVHVQFTPAQQMSHQPLIAARPLWVYAVQPQGIEVSGEITIDIATPALNSRYDYLPPDGTYVVLVGQDPRALQIVPIGVGLLENHRVSSQGKVHLQRLDYLGFAFVPEERQALLQQYAEGKIGLTQLIAALEVDS